MFACAGTTTPSPKTSFTLFVTGQELGALKPCGCSEGQLGGLDRRLAIFDKVPAEQRFVLDIGRFVASNTDQDRIKYHILLQAYQQLTYDAVHMTAFDRDLGDQESVWAEAQGLALFGATSARTSTLPQSITRTLTGHGQSLTVEVVAINPEAALTSWQRSADFTVAVLDMNAVSEILPSLWQDIDVDCVLLPGTGDEPYEINTGKNIKPLVIAMGQKGRHLAQLELSVEEGKGTVGVRFKAVGVTEDLKQDRGLLELYKFYQMTVREENLLEKLPRVPLPDNLEYVGSSQCLECHEWEYSLWGEKKHAHAFNTLKMVGSDADPECVVCHVVGMDYDTGFVTEALTPEFKDVGCEVCHGPGAEHCRSGGKIKTSEPKWSCLKCHSPEHSSGYAGHEKEFREKIRHWKEPKATRSVKDK